MGDGSPKVVKISELQNWHLGVTVRSSVTWFAGKSVLFLLIVTLDIHKYKYKYVYIYMHYLYIYKSPSCSAFPSHV